MRVRVKNLYALLCAMDWLATEDEDTCPPMHRLLWGRIINALECAGPVDGRPDMEERLVTPRRKS